MENNMARHDKKIKCTHVFVQSCIFTGTCMWIPNRVASLTSLTPNDV